MSRRTSQIVAVLLAGSVSLAAAIPEAWITLTRIWDWTNNHVVLWNATTGQVILLWKPPVYDNTQPAIPPAFSPDGKRVAFMIKARDVPHTGNVYVVNNDGTGLTTLCSTFSTATGEGFCNICWTDLGLFWTENTRQIYWADPATGQSKVLGTLATNTTGNHLRMSRSGTRAYLRTDHEVSPGIGGLFFEVPANLSGIASERTFAGVWDHGCAMLNDGSGAIWVEFDCSKIGSPASCLYHKYFAIHDFTNMTQYTTLLPGDPLPDCYELSGPGCGPYTTPCSNDYILYGKDGNRPAGQGTGCPENPARKYIMNIRTRETVDVTPSDDRIAPGSPITRFGSGDIGEFWLGPLPSAHATTPSITIDKTQLLFTDQTAARPETVTVTNGGAGTLSLVTVTEVPPAAWLSTALTGSGNTQRVIMTVSTTGLAPGAYMDTVRVSGGGADNSRSFVVRLVLSAVLPPTNLDYTLDGQSWTPLDVVLHWRDNSTNETAFLIERRTGSGAFSALATAAANSTTFTDTSAARGATYGYRIRATDGANHSIFAETLSVTVPTYQIVVSSPQAGEQWALGSRQRIRWSAPSVQVVQIDLTVDGGDTWVPVTGQGGVSQASASWGDYAWTVPASLGTNASALIRVAQYGDISIAGLSGLFSIGPSVTGPAERNAGRAMGIEARKSAGAIVIKWTLPGSRMASIAIYGLTGRRVAALPLPGDAGVLTWKAPERAAYVVELQTAGDADGPKVLASRFCRLVR